MAAGIGKDEELDLRFSLHVPAGGWLARLANLMGPAPKQLTALMPRQVSGFSTFQFDFHGLYETIFEMIEEFAPEDYGEARAGLDMLQQEMGVDFERDLLTQLSGGIGSFWLEVPREEVEQGLEELEDLGADFPSIGSTTLVGIKDSQRIAGLVDQLLAYAEIGEMIETEDFQGTSVSRIDVPFGPQLSWCFTPRALIISAEPTALRASVRMIGQEDAPNVLDREDFAATFEQNRRASAFSVAETATSLEIMFQTLGVLGSLASLTSGENIFDFEWPDQRLVNKYFKGTMSSSVVRNSQSISLHLATR